MTPAARTIDETEPYDMIEAGAGLTTSALLIAANINPRTGLATDYLNHFNEAVMLMDLIPDMPDCYELFLEWTPLSYAEHFIKSNFRSRDLAIAAYNSADMNIRGEFDAVVAKMTTILMLIGTAMQSVRKDETRIRLAEQASIWIKPMIATAGGIVNGHDQEQDVDDILKQSEP